MFFTLLFIGHMILAMTHIMHEKGVIVLTLLKIVLIFFIKLVKLSFHYNNIL
jgi:hypothetical protein